MANVTAGALKAYMLVNSLYDLQNIQNNLGGKYALGADIDASATATWNSGDGFVPVGPSLSSSFVGSFDGLGHTISHLYIDSDLNLVGLFGALGFSPNNGGQRAYVHDLNLYDIEIAGPSVVGGLAGYANGLLPITNVSVTGHLTVKAIRLYPDDPDDDSTCSCGTVGGVVAITNGAALISNVLTNIAIRGGQVQGGVVGSGTSDIAFAASFGSIGSDTTYFGFSGSLYAGGIAGITGGKVENSYARVSIDTQGFAGGIAGVANDSHSIFDSTPRIFNSYALASVSGGPHFPLPLPQWYVGAITGGGRGVNNYWVPEVRASVKAQDFSTGPAVSTLLQGQPLPDCS